jgi:hypothetical protein
MDYLSDLDAPLLRLSRHDSFTLRDAVAGVHCFGGIGSGKSSGLAKTLAGAYLRAGMGGIVMTAKPDEIALWTDYARRNGRASSLVIFDESSGYNFLAHELSRQGVAGVGSVIECLLAVLEASDHATGSAGKDSEAFWGQSIRQLLQYAVPLLFAAHGTISVSSVLAFVTTAATRAEQYVDAGFSQSSFAAQTLRKAVDDPAVPLPAGELNTLLGYWFLQYPAIPEKTRGNIVISLSTRLDRFLHGRLRDCFCGKTDVVPEMAFGGAVIILAMPALTWKEDGIVGQMTWKYMFQRVIESRNSLSGEQRDRPVFLFADESQFFTSSYDDTFLAICRSSRASMVYLSQTLPSYYARLGKDKTDAVDGLIGKFATQVFFSNSCQRTNEYASKLIGKGIQWRANQGGSVGTSTSRGMNMGANQGRGDSTNAGSSVSGSRQGGSWSRNSGSGSSTSEGQSWGTNVGQGTSETTSWGTSEQMDYLVEPRVFASALRTGGPANRNQVTALWFKAGGHFRSGGGGNVLLATFRQ